MRLGVINWALSKGVVPLASQAGMVDQPFGLLGELREEGGLWLSATFLGKLLAMLRSSISYAS